MHDSNPAPDHNVPRVIETCVRSRGEWNMNIILMLTTSVAHVICGYDMGNNYACIMAHVICGCKTENNDHKKIRDFPIKDFGDPPPPPPLKK